MNDFLPQTLTALRTALLFGYAIDVDKLEHSIEQYIKSAQVSDPPIPEKIFLLMTEVNKHYVFKSDFFCNNKRYLCYERLTNTALQNHCILAALDYIEYLLCRNDTSICSLAYLSKKVQFAGYQRLTQLQSAYSSYYSFPVEKNKETNYAKNFSSDEMTKFNLLQRRNELTYTTRAAKLSYTLGNSLSKRKKPTALSIFSANLRYLSAEFSHKALKSDISVTNAKKYEKYYSSNYNKLNTEMAMFHSLKPNIDKCASNQQIELQYPSDDLLLLYRTERYFNRSFFVYLMEKYNNLNIAETIIYTPSSGHKTNHAFTVNTQALFSEFSVRDAISQIALFPNAFSRQFYLDIICEAIIDSFRDGHTGKHGQIQIIRDEATTNAQHLGQYVKQSINESSIINAWETDLSNFVTYMLNIYFPCNEALYFYSLLYYCSKFADSSHDMLSFAYKMLSEYANDNAQFMAEPFTSESLRNFICNDFKSCPYNSIKSMSASEYHFYQNIDQTFKPPTLNFNDTCLEITENNYSAYFDYSEAVVKAVSMPTPFKYCIEHMEFTLLSAYSIEAESIEQAKQIVAKMEKLQQ